MAKFSYGPRFIAAHLHKRNTDMEKPKLISEVELQSMDSQVLLDLLVTLRTWCDSKNIEKTLMDNGAEFAHIFTMVGVIFRILGERMGNERFLEESKNCGEAVVRIYLALVLRTQRSFEDAACPN